MKENEIEMAAILARRAYQREWRAKNPEKVKENNRRYWERRAMREQEAQDEN